MSGTWRSTGLELIRTLQDHGVHQGIHFHRECTALSLLKDGERIAGVAAYWRDRSRRAFRRATAPLHRERGENPYVAHEELTRIMGQHVGIVREKQELERGIEELQTLKQRVKGVKADGASQYNPGWHEALSLESLLVCSEAMALAAHLREESRGAHTRVDFENERHEWLKYNIVISKGADGQPRVDKVKRKPPTDYLKQIAEANIGTEYRRGCKCPCRFAGREVDPYAPAGAAAARASSCRRSLD